MQQIQKNNMRCVRILFLNIVNVFELKSITFVYFLLSVTSPFTFLLFWIGVKIQKNSSFNFTEIASYYFLLIIASSLLMCHVENDIGALDIQEGGLVKYLLKPFSYLWAKFFEEVPWRILQAAMSLVTLFVILIFFGKYFSISNSAIILFLSFIVAILALLLSYMYKVLLGLLAFWLTDITGVFQLSEMLLFIFAGYVVPLYIFPKTIEIISYILPFSYMIYFPVVVIQGKLAPEGIIGVIGMQSIWLLCFYALYQYTWKKGREKYLGVGS